MIDVNDLRKGVTFELDGNRTTSRGAATLPSG
jgi:hypothetical protein